MKPGIIAAELEQQRQQLSHGPPYYAYLRVSSEEQKRKRTIEAQQTEVEAWARARGVKLTAILKDDGHSGTNITGRPAFMRVLEMLRNGKIGTLVVTAPDRLTRAEDWGDRTEIMRALKAHRTMLAMTGYGDFDPEAETADLMFGNFFTMASMERKRIRARNFGGKMRAVENGRLPSGRPPFGRDYDRQTGTWSINEPEAEIYRRIVNLCLDGVSSHQIAVRLNAENIPSPGGRSFWRQTTVLALLRKRSALGEYTALGKTFAIPAIIDEASFKAVAARLEAGRSHHGAPAHQPRFLSGLMICGACGAGIHVKTSNGSRPQYYVCGSAHHVHRNKAGYVKPECGHVYHRADAVDAAVWQEMQRLLMDPTRLQKAAGVAGSRKAGDEQEIASAEKELHGLDQQQQKLMRLFRKGLASEADLEKQLAEVQKLRKAATVRLEVAQARRAAAASMAAAQQDVASRLKQLATGIQTGATAEQKKALATALFPKVGPFGIRLFSDGRIEAVGVLEDVGQSNTSSRRTSPPRSRTRCGASSPTGRCGSSWRPAASTPSSTASRFRRPVRSCRSARRRRRSASPAPSAAAHLSEPARRTARPPSPRPLRP